MSNPTRVNVLNTEAVYDGFFKLTETEFAHERFDGTMTEPMKRLCLESADAVAVLMADETTGELIFAEEFRWATYEKADGWSAALVAGMIDEGETPLEAAKREVMEEVGHSIDDDKIQFINSIFVSPGRTDERIFVFFAVVNKPPVEANGLDDEDIREIRMTPFAASQWLNQGENIDAKTAMALYWFFMQAAFGGVKTVPQDA